MAEEHVIRTKVTVLGGGMAGLAAAKTLHDRGLHDFVIIEARPGLGMSFIFVSTPVIKPSYRWPNAKS